MFACVFLSFFFATISRHLSCYQLTFQLLSSTVLEHIKVPAVFPVLTFDSFVTVTWFKLPLLPSAVRISLVYPLQLLLYISMKTLVFLSLVQLSISVPLQLFILRSFGEFIPLRWLYIRRSFVIKIKNFKQVFSGRPIYLFPQPLDKLLCWKHGVDLLLCSVLRIQPARGLYQDRRRKGDRQKDVKTLWNGIWTHVIVAAWGCRQMGWRHHDGVLCVWVRQLCVDQIQFDCFWVLHARCNNFPLGFSSFLIPALYVRVQNPALNHAVAQGMCDQETCPDLNECHVISAQNTLKIMRLANSNSCAN